MTTVDDPLMLKRLKIVLVGDSGAGKTSIATRFCHDEFSRQYNPTAGIDFFSRNLIVGPLKNVDLNVWDVSGLALRSSMLGKFIYKADLILLVYDVTNSSSFDILEEWISEIKKLENEENESPLFAVIGNKCDMEHQRTVKRERSHRFAAEQGFCYHDMSARTGEAVSVTLVNLAAQYLGVRLTRTDLDFHKPIVTAEIGDSVDIPVFHDQKIVKRQPNKKHLSIHNFKKTFSTSKSTVCSVQ